MFDILLYFIICYVEIHSEKTIFFQTSIYNYIAFFLLSNIFLYNQYSINDIIINNVITNINVIIYFTGLCYFCFIKGNIDSFKSMLCNIIKKQNVEIQQSSNNLINITNLLIEYINKIKTNNYEYDLIDFGCGDCKTLIKLNSNNKVGIDYNTDIIQYAEDNLVRKRIQNISLHCCNIIDYNFDCESIIYMYEPLWLCSTGDLYYDLFEKIIQTKKEHFIVYISGLFVKHIDLSIIREYKNIKIIREYMVGSLLLNRNVYLLKIN